MALDPITGIFDLGKTLIEKLIPDPKAKAEAAQKLMELQMNGDLQVIAGQLGVNKVEAASASTFVAGWRPFVGWVCATALGVQFIVRPLFVWGSALVGHPTEFPALEMSTMLELLASMLGLSGMRSWEKSQNVQGNH